MLVCCWCFVLCGSSRWTDIRMALVLSSYFKLFVFAMMVHDPSILCAIKVKVSTTWFFFFVCLLPKCAPFRASLLIYWLCVSFVVGWESTGLGVFTSDGLHHWHACALLQHSCYQRCLLPSVLNSLALVIGPISLSFSMHCFIRQRNLSSLQQSEVEPRCHVFCSGSGAPHVTCLHLLPCLICFLIFQWCWTQACPLLQLQLLRVH